MNVSMDSDCLAACCNTPFRVVLRVCCVFVFAGDDRRKVLVTSPDLWKLT